MKDFITFIEETRKEHTLEFMARGLEQSLSETELEVLVNYLTA